jgi:hypothetical protein
MVQCVGIRSGRDEYTTAVNTSMAAITTSPIQRLVI